MQANIFDIQKCSFVDGPGIRTTVFFKGCNLRCAWCHNPESQKKESEMLFYKNKCINCEKCKQICPNSLKFCSFCGRCEDLCPTDARKICGRQYTPQEVMKEIVKDKDFYLNTNGGVTFSGGECMLQIDFLEEILKDCKKEGIHTAIDTAGHIRFENFERIIPYTDLFLYDVKCLDNEKHKRYTGVSNELILENLKRLLLLGQKVWVRIPVIKDVNDSEEEMLKIKSFLDRYPNPEKIELLAYHSMGENKYSALGKSVIHFSVPTAETMDNLRAIFN